MGSSADSACLQTVGISTLAWSRHARTCCLDSDGRALVSPLFLLANGLAKDSAEAAVKALAALFHIESEVAATIFADALDAIEMLQAWQRSGETAADNGQPHVLTLPSALFEESSPTAASLAALCKDSPQAARLLIDLYQPVLHDDSAFVRCDAVRLEHRQIAEWTGGEVCLGVFERRTDRFVAPVGPLVSHATGWLMGGRAVGPSEHSWREFWQLLDLLRQGGFIEWFASLRVAETRNGEETECYRIRLHDQQRNADPFSEAVVSAGQELFGHALQASGLDAGLIEATYVLPVPDNVQNIRLVGELRLVHGPAVWPSGGEPVRHAMDRDEVDGSRFKAWIGRLQLS